MSPDLTLVAIFTLSRPSLIWQSSPSIKSPPEMDIRTRWQGMTWAEQPLAKGKARHLISDLVDQARLSFSTWMQETADLPHPMCGRPSLETSKLAPNSVGKARARQVLPAILFEKEGRTSMLASKDRCTGSLDE